MRKPECTGVHEDFRIKRNEESTLFSHPLYSSNRSMYLHLVIEIEKVGIRPGHSHKRVEMFCQVRIFCSKVMFFSRVLCQIVHLHRGFPVKIVPHGFPVALPDGLTAAGLMKLPVQIVMLLLDSLPCQFRQIRYAVNGSSGRNFGSEKSLRNDKENKRNSWKESISWRLSWYESV